VSLTEGVNLSGTIDRLGKDKSYYASTKNYFI
jgi:hypothetical protein